MTKQQLDEIKQRVEAATGGPWFPCGARYTYISRELSDVEIEDVAEVCNHYRDETQIEKNKYFIAHARTDIPALLEHIESLQGQLAEAREVIKFYGQQTEPDIESVFAKSAAGWGEHVVTWAPLTDMGAKARAFLEKYPNPSETPNS